MNSLARWGLRLFAPALVLAAPHAASQTPPACSAASPVHTVALAELYTSEGCNSCPPADRWLTALTSDASQTARVIGLGLHVDYWDYIGWKDEFAAPRFTQRQRDWSQAHRSRFVYTPQVVLSGTDYRTWGEASVAQDIVRINAKAARADLHLTTMPSRNALAVTASARIGEMALRRDTTIYLALTQDNISTPVGRGENRGVTLKHGNVVRDWLGPFAVQPDGMVTVEKRLPIPKGARLADLRVVMFAQRGAEILQAVALPLRQLACQG